MRLSPHGYRLWSPADGWTDIFIVVEPHKIINGSCTHYRVEICCKPGVRSFRPYLVAPGIYPKNMDFLELLLLKSAFLFIKTLFSYPHSVSRSLLSLSLSLSPSLVRRSFSSTQRTRSTRSMRSTRTTLLTEGAVVNGERAAMYAPDFRLRMSRTRKLLLKEVMKGTKLRTSKRQT